MKKLFKILSIVLIVIFSFSISIQAKEVVQFDLNDTASKNNRIFTLTVSGNGGQNLSVGTFVFEYNADVFKFRDVNKVQDNSKVKFKEETGKLTVIFLDDNGVDLSKSAELFTVDFKAENFIKPLEITLIISDCVNENAESFDAVGDTCKVSVIGNATADNSSNTTSNEKSDTAENATESKNDNIIATDNITATEIQQNGQTNQNEIVQNAENSVLQIVSKDNTVQVLLTGAGFMLALMLVVVLAFYIGRKSK